MTNTTPHGQVPEALTYERDRAIMEGERNASLDAYSRVVLLTSAESRLYERAFTNGWDRCTALRAAHVQNPAEIEHVAGDVSKNVAEVNVSAQQPAPATQQAASSAVLKAISEANMQLVRTGDDAFMLVPYKVATAQAAESVGRDAERYRWLRDCNLAKLPAVNTAFYLGSKHLDEAIDAAMSANGGNK